MTDNTFGAPSSLERATNILKCLANGINSGTEIAAYCDYSISTVHRLLQNLVELRWAIQDQVSHKYFIGPLFHRLSTNVITSHRYLVLHALKEMTRISNLSEETVTLGVFDQFNFLKVHEIPSPHSLRIIEVSDKIKEQYLGATAKVFLSQLEDREVKKFLRHAKNEPLTPNSVVDTSVIMEQIQEIRRQGFSVSLGERIHGAACISAPVTNYFCPAALYIVGPQDRIKPHLDEYIEEVKTGASRISKSIDGAFNE